MIGASVLMFLASASAGTMESNPSLFVYLDESSILTVLHNASPTLQPCLAQAPSDGNLVVEFAVASDGTPANVRFVSSDLEAPTVSEQEECLAKAIATLRFHAHADLLPRWRYVVAWRQGAIVPYPTAVAVPRPPIPLFLSLRPDLPPEVRDQVARATGFAASPEPASNVAP